MRGARSISTALLVGAVLWTASSMGAPGRARPAPGDVGANDLDGRIAKALGQIEKAEAQRKRAESELEGLDERHEKTRAQLRRRARALYRITRAGLLPLAGGFPALLSHLSRVERLERMVVQDLDALESLRNRRDALRERKKQLAARIEKAQQRLDRVRERKRRLEREQAGGRFERTLAKEPSSGAGNWSTAQGSMRLSGESSAQGTGFASKRGQLGTPVSGTFEVRQASREGSPGLEFVADPGTDVRAVAEGRVAFSDRYDPYGRLVIIDHGNNYYTVYAGLGEIRVQLGDHVGRGARLAKLGHGEPSPALFFEVRRGTRTLGARDWLGL
jgi:septal ring factor EnvC (AmiA/AmiB activator)